MPLPDLHAKAHPSALKMCQVAPASLGERAGDYAGLAVAAMTLAPNSID